MARSLGLPSRVVVGFTAGRYSGPGEVTVRGADAHAWPQVYLGARAGWVSFEPTPQQPRGELAAEGVIGPSGVSTTVPTGPTSTPTTAPSPSPSVSVPSTLPGPSGSSGSAGLTATPGSSTGPGVVGWTLIGAVLALGVVLVALLIRRRRRWSPAGRTPDELALLAQAEVGRSLRRAGLPRPAWQPLDLYFADMQGFQDDDRGGSLVADGLLVAHTADAALFAPVPPSDERSRAAYEAAMRIRRDGMGSSASAPSSDRRR
jgi:hypothetical protein